jgi:hypothetical protein
MYRLPCLLFQFCKWPLQQKKKRKEEAYPWKAGTSSRHSTKLKQSILETFDIYENFQEPGDRIHNISFYL